MRSLLGSRRYTTVLCVQSVQYLIILLKVLSESAALYVKGPYDDTTYQKNFSSLPTFLGVRIAKIFRGKKMAAIISQMAANKRARQKRGKRLVPPDKSVYTLPPFDPCFDPMLHNKYIKSVALKTNKLGIRHFTTTTHTQWVKMHKKE